MITAGSLFSGIGGMDLAFSLAGFDIRWQVEIDDFCRKVLAKHSWEYWRNATQFTDVRRVTARNGKGWRRGYQQLERVDVLFGGFPCQDISISGNKAGIREGTRSGLWGEFRRLIGEIRPRAVLLENVPNIVRIGGTTVIADLAALGYDARWGVISAQDAGAPHVRERWWCVAVDNANGARLAARRVKRQSESTHSKSEFTGELVNAASARLEGRKWDQSPESRPASGSDEMGDAYCQRCEKDTKFSIGDGSRFDCGANDEMEYPYSERREEFNTAAINGQQRRFNGRYGEVGLAVAEYETESRLGRNAHGIPNRLDGTRLMVLEYPAAPNQTQHAWEPPRVASKGADANARLKALGNAVVPQVVYPIAVELRRLLETGDKPA